MKYQQYQVQNNKIMLLIKKGIRDNQLLCGDYLYIVVKNNKKQKKY